MIGMSDEFTVRVDGAIIPVVRAGRGRPLILCPGLCTTQAGLSELIGLLRRDHEVYSFDLRGHGVSGAADRYSVAGFLADVTAVVTRVRGRSAVAPVLVGYSLGADLVVHYASEHPGAAAELVLLDGANPVPEPFVTDDDLPEFRAMFEDLAAWTARVADTPHRVLLTAADMLAVNREVDAMRAAILPRFGRIECPVRMVMSTAMAGDDGDDRARRRNRNWRAGIERLVREHPHIRTRWLAAGHDLVHTRAEDIARFIAAGEGPGDWVPC
ncbi:alpha/beta fold hydrolase [Nocardia farcinica]|nr:alpha/beta fold hydrolase [Nocardia farcinica]